MKAQTAPMAATAHDPEYDHHTLTRAAEITGDQRRMDGVRKHHTKQTKALHSVGAMLSGDRSMTAKRSHR